MYYYIFYIFSGHVAYPHTMLHSKTLHKHMRIFRNVRKSKGIAPPTGRGEIRDSFPPAHRVRTQGLTIGNSGRWRVEVRGGGLTVLSEEC